MDQGHELIDLHRLCVHRLSVPEGLARADLKLQQLLVRPFELLLRVWRLWLQILLVLRPVDPLGLVCFV